MVVTLFYLGDQAQTDIAAFLEVPLGCSRPADRCSGSPLDDTSGWRIVVTVSGASTRSPWGPCRHPLKMRVAELVLGAADKATSRRRRARQMPELEADIRK